MAKAKLAPPFNTAGDLDVWAAEVLRLRFDEVLSFGGAALVPGNVNGVHDMRVALRRLRSALRDFVHVINEKPLKRVSRELKKIADALGVVRDRDVAIIALDDLAAEIDDESIKSGIGILIEGLRAECEHECGRLQKTYTVTSLNDLRERFAATIEHVLSQQELFRPATLKEAGTAVIESRLKDFCESGRAIYEPFESVRLHDLRIASKRLRYAIELFAVCFEDDIRKFAAELAKLQSNLGEVHDCDLWIESLSKRLTETDTAKVNDGVSLAAAAWLLSRFTQKRSKEYCSALNLWREWTGNRFVDRLRGILN